MESAKEVFDDPANQVMLTGLIGLLRGRLARVKTEDYLSKAKQLALINQQISAAIATFGAAVGKRYEVFQIDVSHLSPLAAEYVKVP